MIPLPLEQLWVSLLAWSLLHWSDYYLTLATARAHAGPASQVLILEGGVELTPQFRQDVARRRIVSPRFLLSWLLILLWISLLWVLTIRAMDLTRLFRGIVGGMLLLEFAIHLRHLRNLFLFRLVNRTGQPSGRMVYPRRVLLLTSAAELTAFSAFYGLLFILTGAVEAAGGAVLCLLVGVRHWLWSRGEP